jgi:formylglycine-generating enzyme required for sulfatase activity
MKLFISYSSKDRDLIVELADEVALFDYDVWYDRELNRRGGHQWWALICEEIRRCDVFIYALSPQVLKSEACRREYTYARLLGKPVLPVIVGEVEIRYLPIELQAAQLVSFRQRGRDERRALRDSLRNLPPAPPLPADALDLAPDAPLDPVGVLLDRIMRLTNDLDQQRLLIFELDEMVEEDGERAREPLERLVERDDVLTARNLRRAQDLLAKLDVVATDGGARLVSPLTVDAERSRTILRVPHMRVKPRVEDLLPVPFAWIEIPKKGYSIAKYPVTNAQFAKFIEAGGYGERKWWTDAGWEQRQTDGWTEPRYWQDSKWNGTEQPVVGVSWYEAVAFCLWLSDATGEKIMLPTEEQWQYAAQDGEGRDYPWGNEWDCTRCNNSVNPCDSNVTTPVRAYEGKGDSPFGVVDMAGNVWEWCLTDYENKTNDVNSTATYRVLRGGSWYINGTVSFRCGYRGRNNPHSGNNGWGFRLSLS